MSNTCECGRTREQHQLTRWQDEWGERHDFSNIRRMDTPAPMLATTAPAFVKSGWVYERKYDGMRAIFVVTPLSTIIASRQCLPLNEQFPELTQLHLELRPGIYDGEILVQDETGKESLERLQMRMGQTDPEIVKQRMVEHPVTVVFFDILMKGQTDITDLPLWHRREILTEIILPSKYLLSETVRGEQAIEIARARGWEGLVAKEVNSEYEVGKRRATWKKWKISQTQDCVVLGTTEPKGLRKGFGSLKLGAYDSDGNLQEIGLVGSGFREEDIEQVLQILSRTSLLVVEVEFRNWSKTGKLIEPRFKGVRLDKSVSECEIGH